MCPWHDGSDPGQSEGFIAEADDDDDDAAR